MKRFLAVVFLVAASLGSSSGAEPIAPGWMTWDANAEKVEMNIVAGFNPVNNNWNFNGYYDGNMTVVVPVGWRVRITFSTLDGNYPHSLVVIGDPGAPDNLPMQASREDVAIRRAYSKNPLGGMSVNDEDTLSFKVQEAGDYLFFCGVPGHGAAGMWVGFKVRADVDEPHVILAEGADGRT